MRKPDVEFVMGFADGGCPSLDPRNATVKNTPVYGLGQRRSCRGCVMQSRQNPKRRCSKRSVVMFSSHASGRRSPVFMRARKNSVPAGNVRRDASHRIETEALKPARGMTGPGARLAKDFHRMLPMRHERPGQCEHLCCWCRSASWPFQRPEGQEILAHYC